MSLMCCYCLAGSIQSLLKLVGLRMLTAVGNSADMSIDFQPYSEFSSIELLSRLIFLYMFTKMTRPYN